MPIVIESKTKNVQYVAHEEVLMEILGHSNFEGEEWSVGDYIIFENSTIARITKIENELFYGWDNAKSTNVEEVKRILLQQTGIEYDRRDGVKTVEQVIQTYNVKTSTGCLSVLMLLLLICLVDWVIA